MPIPKLPIYVMREKEGGGLMSWQQAWIEGDESGGEIRITPRGLLSGKWQVTLRPAAITSCRVEQVDDPGTTVGMYGGLLGYAIMRLMSRWAKTPVLRFEQPSAMPGERDMVIRAEGYLPRKLTRDLALKINDLLSQHGSKAMLPDLNNQEVWRFPWGPVLVGVGIYLAIIVVLCVALAFLGSAFGS